MFFVDMSSSSQDVPAGRKQWFRGVGYKMAEDGSWERTHPQVDVEDSQQAIDVDDSQTALDPYIPIDQLMPTSAPDKDVVEATKKDLENMQVMAAAWIADDNIGIEAAWVEKIEEFMVEASIAMTDKDELLEQYVVCLGSKYNKLKSMVMAIEEQIVVQ